jgi:glycosyltransferase involved in cell wall biosynthesis
MPIVASNVRGNRDCIRDGQDGLLVPFDDAARTADACRDLLADEARRTAMAQSARRRFEEEYFVEIMQARTWNQAYLPVLAQRGVSLES